MGFYFVSTAAYRWQAPLSLPFTLIGPSQIEPSLRCESQEQRMTIGTILLILLILALVGAFPTWSHSRSWGYGPSGGVGLVLVIVLILFLMGRI